MFEKINKDLDVNFFSDSDDEMIITVEGDEVKDEDDVIDISESDGEDPFDDPGMKQQLSSLIAIRNFGGYDNINKLSEGTIAMRLNTDTSKNTAMVNSMAVTARQGKYRFGYADEGAEMMTFAERNDIDVADTENVVNYLVLAINQFIAAHNDQIVAETSKVTDQKYHKDCVKVVLIMLYSNGMKLLVKKLIIPEYAKEWIDKVEDAMEDGKEAAFNDFVNYLVETGNDEAAEAVVDASSDFFSETKAATTFSKYFKNIELKDAESVYEKFLECSERFAKWNGNITQKSIYGFFDITDDAYTKRKNKVIKEFAEMYSKVTNDTDTNVSIMYKLLYGETKAK